MYYATNVSVTLSQLQQTVTARTYVQNNKAEIIRPGHMVPVDRRPSITYREVNT